MVDNYLNQYFPTMRREEQITSSHCGPAVIKMLLSYKGISVTQMQLSEAAGIKKTIKYNGATISDLAAGVTGLFPNTVQFWYKKNADMSDLIHLTNYYQTPVGVEWQGVFGEYGDGEDGHYSVVTHVDESSGLIYIADPYYPFAGQDRIFRLSLFEKRWWDINEIYDEKKGKDVEVEDKQLMFVITRKNEDYPALLKMVPYIPE